METFPSTCTFQIEDLNTILFLGLSNGEIVIFHSSGSPPTFSTGRVWTFASETRSLNHILPSSGRNIFAACGSRVYSLDYEKETVTAIISVFQDAEIAGMTADGDNFWCFSSDSSVIKGFSGGKGISGLKSVDVGNDESPAVAVSAVEGTLWVALGSGKIHILDVQTGEWLGQLQVPKDRHFPNTKVWQFSF